MEEDGHLAELAEDTVVVALRCLQSTVHAVVVWLRRQPRLELGHAVLATEKFASIVGGWLARRFIFRCGQEAAIAFEGRVTVLVIFVDADAETLVVVAEHRYHTLEHSRRRLADSIEHCEEKL